MTEHTSGPGLSTSEQTAVQEQLAAERESIRAQIAALSGDFDAIVEASTSVATDDEHDPEGSTIAFERAQVTALLSQARSHLADLDRALERLREGIYGTCEGCGQTIASERLAARPAARTCIRCAAARTR